MLWIDAEGVLTEVVERESFGYRPDVELVGRAVGKPLHPFSVDIPVEVAVPVRGNGPEPDPAVVAVSDLRLEPLALITRFWPTHPTKFTELIGHQLMQHLQAVAA